MKTILIICPYFGELPNYFDHWVTSVKFNPTINWLLLGDKIPQNLPGNINKIDMTFDEMRSRVQNCFDFPINLDKPYKLCDFKPAYGLIFQEEIKDYDFWSYGDVDLIYGDLRRFITEDLLEQYDRVFSFGHLSLFRNTEEINKTFKRNVADCFYYKDVFSTSNSCTFDEWGRNGIGGYYQICVDAGMKIYNEIVCADIDVKYKGLKCDFGGSDNKRKAERRKRKIYFKYDNGKLTQHWGSKKEAGNKKEIAYIHLQKRQMKNTVGSNAEHFYIYPNVISNGKKNFFAECGYSDWYYRYLFGKFFRI